MEIKDCRDAEINGAKYQGEKFIALNDDASCIKFDQNAEIEGAPGSSVYKFIEVIVRACDETNDDCKTKGINAGDTIASNPKLYAAYNRIRVVTLQFNFVEAGARMDDHDDPMKLNINSNHELRMDVFQEKYRTFFFQQFTVEDVTGWFSDEIINKTSIAFDKVITETTTRDPGNSDIEFQGPDGPVERSANYMTMRLQASNTHLKITRTYTKLIDVFADVGGVAEILTFIIAILYSWHNNVRMEQALINKGIINSQDVPQGEFGYRELLCFNYFGCCKKKSKRKVMYENCLDSMYRRMDILEYLKKQGNSELLQGALLKPYQLKLVPFLALSENGKNVLTKKEKKAKDMKFEDCMEKVTSGEGKSDLSALVDQWLLENLDMDKIEEFHRDLDGAEYKIKKEGKVQLNVERMQVIDLNSGRSNDESGEKGLTQEDGKFVRKRSKNNVGPSKILSGRKGNHG